LWLIPRLGQQTGRVVSPVILSAVAVLVTWLTIGWIAPGSGADALKVGGLWLLLTLAFEFLVGHYGFRKPWPVLLEDYHIERGRIWIIVLLTVLFAPLWTAKLRRILR
jgi:hypothetical protein